MTQQTDNRRRFSRVAFHHEATLHFPGDAHPHPVEIHDLSLNGALLKPRHADAPALAVNQPCVLKIFLDAGGTAIRMEGSLMHHLANFYGLACKEMDLESVTHLRRLVQLNLGDEALAEREFSHLIQGE